MSALTMPENRVLRYPDPTFAAKALQRAVQWPCKGYVGAGLTPERGVA